MALLKSKKKAAPKAKKSSAKSTIKKHGWSIAQVEPRVIAEKIQTAGKHRLTETADTVEEVAAAIERYEAEIASRVFA